MLSKACCFLDGRTRAVSGISSECLKQKLFCEALRLTREGVDSFWVTAGMAGDEVNLYAAEAVLLIRGVRASGTVRLKALVSNEDQLCVEWRKVLKEADEIVHLSTSTSKETRCPVDDATHLIAVCDRGESETVELARRRGLNITIIHYKEDESYGTVH